MFIFCQRKIKTPKNIIISIRPHGQAVKTTPSHGVNSGSIPDEVTETSE